LQNDETLALIQDCGYGTGQDTRCRLYRSLRDIGKAGTGEVPERSIRLQS
jgi:hypothetical protein